MTEREELLARLTGKDAKTACAYAEALTAECRKSDRYFCCLDDFAALLRHKNSLVRNRAIAIIAANARWDTEGRYDAVTDELLTHVTDEKPITARQCVKALPEIAEAKPELIPKIRASLENADLSGYRDSMRPLIGGDIAGVLRELAAIERKEQAEKSEHMKPWFTIDEIDEKTHIISEYRHWEETHCYLLEGGDRALLIDTGLGICDISAQVENLTDKPVTAAATHIHWDHIGGHRYYPDLYAHEAELDWLSGRFPLSIETVRGMVTDRCELPEGYDVGTYELFRGTPTRVLRDGDTIDLGGREITVLHTPGHSPGHMCFWEPATGYLFTGDLVYKGTLFACYPSTDPQAYLKSLERVAALPAERVFPAHHTLDIQPEILPRMRDAFRALDAEGMLHHGSGTFDHGDWAVWL